MYHLIPDADPESSLVAYGEGDFLGESVLIALYEFDTKDNPAAPSYKGIIVLPDEEGGWNGKRLAVISLWVKEGAKCVASGQVELTNKKGQKFNTFLLPPKEGGAWEGYTGFIVEKNDSYHPSTVEDKPVARAFDGDIPF